MPQLSLYVDYLDFHNSEDNHPALPQTPGVPTTLFLCDNYFCTVCQHMQITEIIQNWHYFNPVEFY